MKQFLSLTLLFLFLNLSSLYSQPRNLVFEGAGIRGIAYSGAIKELEKRDLLKGIERVGGTSAGAITALLISIGYNSNEITEIINSTSFNKFNDGKYFFVGGINRFKKFYGWYRGEQFDNWISELIEAKTNNADISFADLHKNGFKDLFVTATCLNKQSLVILSRETYPDMKIKAAVRISMSIPLYFEAVFINAEGKLIHHPKNKEGLDIMVDGGFIANFPIKLFDSTKYLNSSQQNKFEVNHETIGFRIDREDQIKADADNKGHAPAQKTLFTSPYGPGLAPMAIKNLSDYFNAFYNIIIENLNRQSLSSEDWQRTVSISDGNVGPRIRKLTTAEIERLTTNGTNALKNFLDK